MNDCPKCKGQLQTASIQRFNYKKIGLWCDYCKILYNVILEKRDDGK